MYIVRGLKNYFIVLMSQSTFQKWENWIHWHMKKEYLNLIFFFYLVQYYKTYEEIENSYFLP